MTSSSVRAAIKQRWAIGLRGILLTTAEVSVWAAPSVWGEESEWGVTATWGEQWQRGG